MKKSILVKAIVVLFLSLIFGLYFYFDEIKKSIGGKDEYLRSQSIRFDNYFLHPKFSALIIGTFILAVFLFGLYELICYFIFKVINKREKLN